MLGAVVALAEELINREEADAGDRAGDGSVVRDWT